MQHHMMRRLIPRQPADWRATYLIEGEDHERWRDCRVIDISSLGAGLELLGTTPDEIADHELIVAVYWRTKVKNSRPGNAAGLRVGTQFLDLTERESAYVDSLTEIGAQW
jgi:hypothetical protein